LLEVLEETPPTVVVFSGQELENEFGQMIEGLEDIGYKVKYEKTGRHDIKEPEVRYQAIAYYDDTLEEEF